jgi:hypothetical protein
MVNGRAFALGAIGGAGVSVQLALAGRAVASAGSATGEASQSGIGMRTRLADDADEFRVDLGSGGVVEPGRWEGTTMSTMTSVRANGVELGVETFGRDDGPLVLLAGGPTMLSWPDSVCERLAAGGRRVVRYDLRDCGAPRRRSAQDAGAGGSCPCASCGFRCSRGRSRLAGDAAMLPHDLVVVGVGDRGPVGGGAAGPGEDGWAQVRAPGHDVA